MEHPAISFLRLLDPAPSARYIVECYTDVKPKGAKPKPDPLGRQFKGQSLAEVETLLPKLTDLNARGAGIFTAVNAFDGRRHRKNLVGVRGVHADLDGVEQDVLDDIRSRLKPTLEVKTSGPGNWHFYWLLSEGELLSVEKTEAINRGLAELGADAAAVDVTRLLRLPGFYHMKSAKAGG